MKSFCKDNLVFVLICSFIFCSSTLYAQSLQSFEDYFSKSDLGKPQKRESEHFVVLWVNERDQVLVDGLLQHMEEARRKLAPSFQSAMSSKKVPIEIFPDLRSFSDVSKLSLARFRATGTIALTLDQRLMILSPRNLTSGYSWAETAVHEYIHYLIREISPDLVPIWLHEGTAQLFQGYPYEIKPQLRPSQWGLFKKRREAGKLLDLVTLQEPFPYRETPEEAELAYIQAFLFVDWLDRQCGVVQLIESIERLKNFNQGLERCAKKPLEQLEKDFIPVVMKGIQVPLGQDVEWYARDFSGRDPLEIEGDKADRKSKNLAQLSSELFRQGRYRAAGIEMNKALNETPVAPPSWRRHLALSLQKSDQEKEAVQVLQNLLEDYPEDAGAWFLLGQKRVQEQNWKSAWEYFLRSFFRNPFLDGLQDQMKLVEEREPKLKNRYLLNDI